MKIGVVRFSDIKRTPTQRLDAEYYIGACNPFDAAIKRAEQSADRAATRLARLQAEKARLDEERTLLGFKKETP